jgi:hypothetical protein
MENQEFEVIAQSSHFAVAGRGAVAPLLDQVRQKSTNVLRPDQFRVNLILVFFILT